MCSLMWDNTDVSRNLQVEKSDFGTALLEYGKAYVQAGGGWVNDSEPEAEFQETVNKSKAMLKAVALAETFAKD